ncbi:MAG: cohesin domain-containing protein [Pyrinomonadaceae bacterium]
MFVSAFLHRSILRLLSAGLFVFLCSFSASPQRKPLPREELEKYDDPPAAFYQTGVSPGMVSTFGSFTSRQANVNSSGQNITGDAANEPSITVDPTNHNRMTIGWRQFNSVTSNFRQAGYGYTSDGGLTWVFPGVLENNVFRSDPVLASDNTGRFFYNSLISSFFDNIWRSSDGGQSWLNLQPAGNATGGDKQWYTIDNTNSTGRGFQYQAWSTAGNNFGGRQFSRSTDGGVTWMDPIFIPNSPVWGTLDVDTNGNLFVGGVSFNTGEIFCIRSSNAKNGAVTPTFEQSATVDLGGDISFSEPINPGGLLGQVFLAVDRSGTATNNNVYLLASVIPFGAATGSDVMFARSTNGGQTFSPPVRVNDDPNSNVWQWFGTFAVAPNGRLDAVWLDARNAPNGTDSQLFYSYSTNGGVTWSANVAVSDAFDPFLGYPQQNKLGDYITIVSDNAGADVAYAATFNGEQDVYYVRVAPESLSPAITGTVLYDNAIPATPRSVPNVLINGAGSVAVSSSTGVSGTYALSGFGSGSYTVTPSKSGGQHGAITSFDAARIAQHAAGVSPLLVGNQLIVADVSGNGTVSSFDSGQVARYAVSLPPFGSTGNWRFSPVNRTYSSVTASITNQDYAALLMGEVSGNWLNTARPEGSVRSPHVSKGSTSRRGITVAMPSVTALTGDEIVVPISVKGVANKGIISYEFNLRYDPLVLQPLAELVNVDGTVSRGLMFVVNPNEPGLLRVAVYGPMPISENGILLNLRFVAIGANGSASHLSFERILFNEGSPQIAATNGLIEIAAAGGFGKYSGSK